MLSRSCHGGLQLARSVLQPCRRCEHDITSTPRRIWRTRQPSAVFTRTAASDAPSKKKAALKKKSEPKSSPAAGKRTRSPESTTPSVIAPPRRRISRSPKAGTTDPGSNVAPDSSASSTTLSKGENDALGSIAEEPTERKKRGGKKPATDFETHLNDVQEKITKPRVKSRRASASTIKIGTPTQPLGSGAASVAEQLMLQAKWPTAERLAKSRTWTNRRGRHKKGYEVSPVVEKKRVNIVSEDLCNDVLNYIGPSLERHRGCDLVDLNPGVGVFSRKLHDFLQPRKHIMMDVDADTYQPYLEDLLAKDNVVMIPQSGVIWGHLSEMMDTHLAHQPQINLDSTPERNDTLLVIGNFAQWPRTPFASFESLGKLVLYQFISSIRNTALFQRYGCVRMLLWVNEEDKRQMLPTALPLRKGVAVEAEASCEWIHEVVGKDVNHDEMNKFVRDHWMILESAARTAQRMKDAGMVVPPGRQSRLYKEIEKQPDLMGRELTGVHPPYLKRNWRKELAKSKPDDESTEQQLSRHKYLRNRQAEDVRTMPRYHRLLQLYQQIHVAACSADPEQRAKLPAMQEEYHKAVSTLVRNDRIIYNTLLDSLIHFRLHSPPTLLHDRRAYEPLAPAATDFFPNEPASLLDIQPKPVHPLLRQRGPSSTRSGDMSELMLRQWYQAPTVPLSRNLDSLWPGFADVGGALPSLADPARGGSAVVDFTPRMLTEGHWVDLVEAWMAWPFRPTYNEMLGRLLDEDEDADEDDGAPGSGMGD